MLKQITPLVPVADLERSLAFFCNTLGFEVRRKDAGYAYLFRDSVGLRLVVVDDGASVSQSACYIDVENLDAVYQEMKPQLDLLPTGRVREPFNQPYGQREFHVRDEDSLLIFFGEAATE